jgi:hypothetical protein
MHNIYIFLLLVVSLHKGVPTVTLLFPVYRYGKVCGGREGIKKALLQKMKTA